MYSREGKGNKTPVHKGMQDAYEYYVQMTGNPYKLTQKRYSEIFKAVMEKVMKEIIYHNWEFTLPAGLGHMRIRKTKIRLKLNDQGQLITKRLNPDWYETKKLWEQDEEAKKNKTVIYHMNDHTDRYNMAFYFDKRTSFVKNQTAYSFEASRKWKRELTKALKNEDLRLDYYE